MTWNPLTIVLAACSLGLIVYEIASAVRHSVETPTISQIIWRLSARPAIPFFCGLLGGHLFL